MFACSRRYNFVTCLEHYMRKAELQNEADYKPLLVDLEELSALEQAQPIRRFSRNRFEERLKSAAWSTSKSKRNSHDSEELMKIFSQIMTNNMRLKSNIKTSRF